MKALLFRATAPAVTLASCICMFGGVANAQSVSITDSGRNSSNTIEFKNICKTDVTNDTNISLSNSSSQSATSGSADVSNNDDVGSVTTGNSSNTNTSSFTVGVTNDTSGCFAQQTQQQSGGMGGGETSTPVATTTTAAAPTGGLGGGELAAAPQVAVVPTGGVGAGEGGPAYLAGLAAVTLASGAFAVRRLQKSHKNQF